MYNHRLLHSAWQDLEIGIKEVTDPVSSLDHSHSLQAFLLCSTIMIAVLEGN